MNLRERLLPEFDAEMATTRKLLERIPPDKLTFQPHEKSFVMGSLAYLVAGLPAWATLVLTKDHFDLADFGGYPKPEETRVDDLLKKFDENVAQGRQDLAAAPDDVWDQPWSLMMRGNKLMTNSKYAVYRQTVINHLVHHRAQLGVYLRLVGATVPAMYGPSADERTF